MEGQIPEIPDQPQVPIQQPETAPVLPKKKSKLPTIVLLLIAILFIAGGVYYFKFFNRPKACTSEAMICPDGSDVGRIGPNCEFAPCPQSTEIPTAIPTVDETANWKTYTNTKYNYKFKHPTERNFKITLTNSNNSNLYVIRETIGGGYIDGWDVIISVWDNPQKLNLIEWLNYLKNSNALPLPAENKLITANSSIGGVDAFRTWNDPLSNGEQPGKCVQACPILDIYFVKNGYGYRVGLNYTEEVDTKSQKIFDQILSTFKFLDNSELRETTSALSVYQQGQLSEREKELLSNFSWPKLKSFKIGDKTREIYLVDCDVTNDKMGVKLTGVPTEIANVSNVAEISLKKLMENHFGGFPTPEEIARYRSSSGIIFKNNDSGINGVLLKEDGTLIVNFYDAVAAYGGGSARIGCMSLSTRLTAMQFPTVKKVMMCIDKTENCQLDFQP